MSNFFIQPPHCGHGHRHRHGHRGLVAILACPSPSFPTSSRRRSINTTYVGADAQTVEAVRGHAHRAADERRGQHELHVLHQRQQRRDDAECRSSISRPTPTSTRFWPRCGRRRPHPSCRRTCAITASPSRSPLPSPLMVCSSSTRRRAPTTRRSWPTTPISTSTTR